MSISAVERDQCKLNGFHQKKRTLNLSRFDTHDGQERGRRSEILVINHGDDIWKMAISGPHKEQPVIDNKKLT